MKITPRSSRAIGTSASHRRIRPCGWTLIELIGALAISAVLLAVVAPALLHELDRTARTLEERRLRQLAEAIRDDIQRSGRIPDPAALAAFVAPTLGWRSTEIDTNARGLVRAAVFDPACRIGPGTNRSLPYSQTWLGSDEPAGSRLVLLSSLGEPLAPSLTNGASLAPEAFEAIWQVAPETIPSGWTWAGRGEDLLVQRLDLADLFIPVTLNNSGTAPARFGLAATNAGTLGAGSFTTWYLRGTALQLLGEDGLLQSIEVILAPVSWVYQGGKWRRTGAWNTPPSAPSGRDFEELADAFRRAPANPDGPADAAGRVLSAMTNYTASYQSWAAAGFGAPLPADSAPMRAWRDLQQATAELLASP